jgi:hypothetical protein
MYMILYWFPTNTLFNLWYLALDNSEFGYGVGYLALWQIVWATFQYIELKSSYSFKVRDGRILFLWLLVGN